MVKSRFLVIIYIYKRPTIPGNHSEKPLLCFQNDRIPLKTGMGLPVGLLSLSLNGDVAPGLYKFYEIKIFLKIGEKQGSKLYVPTF